MDDAKLKTKIEDIAQLFTDCPAVGKAGMNVSEGTYVPSESAASSTAVDSLDHLRLQVKYLVFDLEATKRENKYLRKMLQRRMDDR
jgi:hypothetical protein